MALCSGGKCVVGWCVAQFNTNEGRELVSGHVHTWALAVEVREAVGSVGADEAWVWVFGGATGWGGV